MHCIHIGEVKDWGICVLVFKQLSKTNHNHHSQTHIFSSEMYKVCDVIYCAWSPCSITMANCTESRAKHQDGEKKKKYLKTQWNGKRETKKKKIKTMLYAHTHTQTHQRKTLCRQQLFAVFLRSSVAHFLLHMCVTFESKNHMV